LALPQNEHCGVLSSAIKGAPKILKLTNILIVCINAKTHRAQAVDAYQGCYMLIIKK
jgi:hypothetical protein